MRILSLTSVAMISAMLLPLPAVAATAAMRSAPAVLASASSVSSSSSSPHVRINLQNNMPVSGDFIVGPARFVLTATPGTEQTVEVQLTNRLGTSGIFTTDVVDFDTDPQSNAPRFYAAGDNGPYSARNWITPEADTMTLKHAERAFIRVRIAVPKDAEPGDHEAALTFLLKSGSSKPSGINIVSRVAVLFVLTVPGKAVEDASIDGLSVRHGINWNYPIFFRLSASNRGNIHVSPEGSVVIRNVFGVPVDEIPIRDWVMLRDSKRMYDFEWAPQFAIGRYTAEANVSLFGKKTHPVSVSFWVLPLLPVLVLLFAIFVVSFLVQYVFSRFELKRKK